uniref:Phosphorylase kinase beta n=1 Tax=Mus musculus TaxID=10090 RepID=E0CY30_MOUSE
MANSPDAAFSSPALLRSGLKSCVPKFLINVCSPFLSWLSL